MIPSWVCCDMRENGEIPLKSDKLQRLGIASINSSAEPRPASHACNGVLSCSPTDISPNLKAHTAQKMKKGWKRRDCLQQQARQERLESSRSRLCENDIDEMAVNMTEDDMENRPVMKGVVEESSAQDLKETSSISEDLSCIIDYDSDGLIKDSGMMLQDQYDDGKTGINMRSCHDNNSGISTDPACLGSIENELEDTASSTRNAVEVVEENTSEASKLTLKSKRHPDMDNNPKPSKCPRPIDESSKLSYKYSVESFCSIDDHLPDGFYDAGRDMPFMPLEEYERSLGLYAREVILLDRLVHIPIRCLVICIFICCMPFRIGLFESIGYVCNLPNFFCFFILREQDEELDAIASSAQLLLSSLKRPSYSETDEDAGQDLLRASVLALFVSDCFGGCDRSASLRRTRGAIVSLRKEQPFICTCAAGSMCDSNEASKQASTPPGHFNFTGLCDKSIHIIKERNNSGIVPIGALQFGVCRHRAVLMKVPYCSVI